MRTKLLAAMLALIAFMTGTFFLISHGYMEGLFRQYAVAAREGEAEQWAMMLSYYYEKNGHSWLGVDKYAQEVLDQKIATGRVAGLERLVVLDLRQKPIFTSDSAHMTQEDILREGIQVPISDDGKKIGTLSILDRDLQRLNRLQASVLASMTKATFTGAAFTFVVALLIGIWLTRLLTEPLGLLVKAIQRISTGDLAPHLPEEVMPRDEFGQVAEAFNTMATQLRRNEEVRRHLVADVAHELRTPLTIVLGQLELIQQGVRSPSPEVLLPIQDEVMRLTRLVGDLHQLTLAEAGVLPLEKSYTDLVSLVTRVADNFQVEAEEAEVTLSVTPTVNEAFAWVDPHRMTQVFVNLLGNAMRYTPRGGTIYVNVKVLGTSVRISVRDTGPGIDQSHLPNLFNRFYRVEEARSRGNGGMGLGLAIAKEFVEAHKGQIDVESKVGEGTTFHVTIPIQAS